VGVYLKIILQKNKVVLVGKSWEIRRKLKEYGNKYETVAEWLKVANKE
jgi:hypothetical protein